VQPTLAVLQRPVAVQVGSEVGFFSLRAADSNNHNNCKNSRATDNSSMFSHFMPVAQHLTLRAAEEIKVLGVMLDRRLTFHKLVSAVARSCNYHAQDIRHIRHLLTTELAHRCWHIL